MPARERKLPPVVTSEVSLEDREPADYTGAAAIRRERTHGRRRRGRINRRRVKAARGYAADA